MSAPQSRSTMRAPETLLVVGTGGLAKEVAQLARRIDPDGRIWGAISYVAASESEKGTALPFGGVDYCDDDIAESPIAADAVIAVGAPALRHVLATRYSALPKLRFPNLIHPSVPFDPTLVKLGKGNVIAQSVI